MRKWDHTCVLYCSCCFKENRLFVVCTSMFSTLFGRGRSHKITRNWRNFYDIIAVADRRHHVVMFWIALKAVFCILCCAFGCNGIKRAAQDTTWASCNVPRLSAAATATTVGASWYIRLASSSRTNDYSTSTCATYLTDAIWFVATARMSSPIDFMLCSKWFPHPELYTYGN